MIVVLQQCPSEWHNKYSFLGGGRAFKTVCVSFAIEDFNFPDNYQTVRIIRQGWRTAPSSSIPESHWGLSPLLQKIQIFIYFLLLIQVVNQSQKRWGGLRHFSKDSAYFLYGLRKILRRELNPQGLAQLLPWQPNLFTGGLKYF